MKYLLDSNTYIQAKNLYYGMDICPGYWSWLDRQFELGQVGSIVMVADELKAGDDDLVDWVTQRPNHFINIDDADTQTHYRHIANLVYKGDYNKGNRDSFLATADPWIIAKARTINATVVTNEVLIKDPQAKKVKIPNICVLYDVSYTNAFSLLRDLSAKFVI